MHFLKYSHGRFTPNLLQDPIERPGSLREIVNVIRIGNWV